MNPLLDHLQTYPFEKLRQLFKGVTPPSLSPINLGIGEPRHETPAHIKDALSQNLNGLSHYPATIGLPKLREAISNWISRRYAIPKLDIATQIIPTLGSREALFSLAQAVLNPKEEAYVLCPNPFYQIYEGATLLGGATPYFVNADERNRFLCDYTSVPASILKKTRLIYVCSPANPTGAVLNLDDWKTIFELSDKYGFVIASDECYSEIYMNQAPLGALQAAHLLGRSYERIVMLSSLSKRSNVPGMRSGFVAGDEKILKPFLLYRTYHGCAMSQTIQEASISAWNDEEHVIQNRLAYKEKFEKITPLLKPFMNVSPPNASFYLWADIHEQTGLSDTEFAKALYETKNVTVLPGSYLARSAHGINPGENKIRLALVAQMAECLEATNRIIDFMKEHQK